MNTGLAEHLAGQVRRQTSTARRLPLDIYALAHEFGVENIAIVDGLIEDGRLEQREGIVRVLLSARATPQRQRYTLAHELGHLLLADPDKDTIARRMRSDDDVERFCDAFAAALLQPRDVVIREYSRAPRTLATVRHLADRTQTSLAAATVRLREVLEWQQSLLHWKRTDRGWHYRWGAGVPRASYRSLRSAAETTVDLDLAAERGRAYQPVSVRMHLGAHTITISGKGSVRGRSALGLFDLPRPK